MIYRFAEGISWFIGIEDEIETQYLLNFLEFEVSFLPNPKI